MAVQKDDVCRSQTECQEEAVCSGTSPICPPSTLKPDTSFCNNHTRTCEQGECKASVCKNIGWSECMLSRDNGASDEEMCSVACKNSQANQTKCISSLNTEELDKPENAVFKQLLVTIKNAEGHETLGLKKTPGSLCDNYLGYCDILTKCRQIDAEGPFKQLTDMIFDPMNFERIADWITDHWWAVLLMGIGFVIFMGVFVWLFSYNTPKTNPNHKPTRGQGRGHQPHGQGARHRPQGDKRSGVYSVGDYPMHERRPQGYDNGGYRHSGAYPNQPGQHFDRIAQPKRY